MTSCMTSWHWGLCQRLARVARRVRDISQSAHEAREMSMSTRRSAWNDAGDHRTFWWCVGMRVWASWPEIFRSYRSKAVEDPYRANFVKLWVGLHKFEGLGRGLSKDFGGAWRRIRLFLLMSFLGFAHRGPLDQVVIPFPCNEVWICANMKE